MSFQPAPHPPPPSSSGVSVSTPSFFATTGLTPAGIWGRLALGVCVGLLPLWLLMPYAKTRIAANGTDDTVSGWEYMQSSDILITLIAVAVVALVVLSFLQPHRKLWVEISIPLALFAAGLMWPGGAFGDFGTNDALRVSVQAGGVFGVLIALLGAGGGIMAMRAPAGHAHLVRPSPPEPAASPPRGKAKKGPSSPEPTTLPPAGWYDDPRDEARLRYWDGTTWTDHTAA